jgi:hypothetical protein
MMRVIPFIVLVMLFPANAGLSDTNLPPIKEIKNVKPRLSVFKAARRKKPLEIRSEKEATAHFQEKDLARLKKQVDFDKQIVLVFAWRGSGQDKLQYRVLESFPEQIVFKIKPGRTRDLRPHVRIFVLRSNVKWRMQ